MATESQESPDPQDNDTPTGEIQSMPFPPVDADDAAMRGMTMHYAEHFEGPLPHPAAMERYAKIYPDAPKIIFRTFEKQVNHRHEMEATLMHGSERRARVGQFLGTGLLLCALGVAALLAWPGGQPILGGAIAGGVLAAGALSYVFGDRPPRS